MLDNLPDYLERWDDGSIRLAGHRIGLHIILEAHKEGGMTAEHIQEQYPTLEPGLVGKVLAYCSENQAETDRYYEESKAIAERNYEAWKNSEMSRRGPSREELRRRWIERGLGPLPGHQPAATNGQPPTRDTEAERR
jgi:uncharacterized protein (DUF433 family)